MDNYIARQNVARFRRLLSEERDADERRILSRLLELEEAKLAENDPISASDSEGPLA